MLNNRGMTLIESLLALSIFLTSIMLVFDGYHNALKRQQFIQRNYIQYIYKQNERELCLWSTTELDSSIEAVLH